MAPKMTLHAVNTNCFLPLLGRGRCGLGVKLARALPTGHDERRVAEGQYGGPHEKYPNLADAEIQKELKAEPELASS